MSVTISEQGKGILALCESKEKLVALAQIQNLYIESITKDFNKNVLDSSKRQKEILEQMAAIDKAIEDIAKLSVTGYQI